MPTPKIATENLESRPGLDGTSTAKIAVLDRADFERRGADAESRMAAALVATGAAGAASGAAASGAAATSAATAAATAVGAATAKAATATATAAEAARAASWDRATRLKEELGDAPLEGIEHRYAYRFVKRAFDIVFSAAIIVAFCWLFALVAIAVKIDDPTGPAVFKQRRVTKDGREFTMYKFRSMCVDAEQRLASLAAFNEKTGPVFKIANDPRVTRVGRVIRKLSLDELPQFFNVLKGDMSVIGPRPALPSEVATYGDRERQRLLIKGGISCYWQTRRNRDTITFDEWLDLDLLYIRKCSLWTDIKLIVQTIGVVLTAQGS